MTTAVATKLETEIVALVEQRLARLLADNQIHVGHWINEMLYPINPDCPDFVWSDLRPTEAARASELCEGVYTAADVLTQEMAVKVVDLAVAAALTFAQEHPDAPRAAREPVPA